MKEETEIKKKKYDKTIKKSFLTSDINKSVEELAEFEKQKKTEIEKKNSGLNNFATIVVLLGIILLFSSIWVSGLWLWLKMLITSILLMIWGYAIWDKVEKQNEK